MSKVSNMSPTSVPEIVKRARPWGRVFPVGPPIGVSDDECGTVESMYAFEDGRPVYRDYWRPTQEQLEILNNGGFIELAQYAPQMAMHSMQVWEEDQE